MIQGVAWGTSATASAAKRAGRRFCQNKGRRSTFPFAWGVGAWRSEMSEHFNAQPNWVRASGAWARNQLGQPT